MAGNGGGGVIADKVRARMLERMVMSRACLNLFCISIKRV